MEYRNLGQTGLKVSRICLGCLVNAGIVFLLQIARMFSRRFIHRQSLNFPAAILGQRVAHFEWAIRLHLLYALIACRA